MSHPLHYHIRRPSYRRYMVGGALGIFLAIILVHSGLIERLAHRLRYEWALKCCLNYGVPDGTVLYTEDPRTIERLSPNSYLITPQPLPASAMLKQVAWMHLSGQTSPVAFLGELPGQRGEPCLVVVEMFSFHLGRSNGNVFELHPLVLQPTIAAARGSDGAYPGLKILTTAQDEVELRSINTSPMSTAEWDLVINGEKRRLIARICAGRLHFEIDGAGLITAGPEQILDLRMDPVQSVNAP